MLKGTVFNIQRYSIHNGPGIRTTVFLKGCPLSCWWCHNPEGQSAEREIVLKGERCIGCGACQQACPSEAIQNAGGTFATQKDKCTECGECAKVCPSGARALNARYMTAEEVLREIDRDSVFYDESGGGVTFSGGEPLAQPEFLARMLKECRRLCMHSTVDTCGFAARDTLLAIAPYADLFLYDLKLMDDKKHREYTGVSNRVILENLIELCRAHKQVFIRLPLIPGINDDGENIMKTGAFISSLDSVGQVNILPYHHTGMDKYARLGKTYKLSKIQAPPEASVERALSILKNFGLNVKVGG